jgi:hypothetical protein
VVFLIAVIVGFLFGGADQYLGSLISLGPWAASVSGMSAPWLVFPFAFGLSQMSARRAALVGLTATASAVIGYFVLTLSPLEGVSLSHVDLIGFAHSQREIIVGGLVTGPLFGFLGQRWRTTRSWLSAALVAGVLCLEPLARFAVGRLDPPRDVWVIEVVIGAALAAYFLIAGAVYRQRSRRPV